MWRNLGHLHSEIELTLFQETMNSAGHLQCAGKLPSLSFLMTKKAHLCSPPVSLLYLLTPWHIGTHAYAYTHMYQGDDFALIPE